MSITLLICNVENTMEQLQSPTCCKVHIWERRLEYHHGVQCVVRYCLECGHRELCWSRRPVSLEAGESKHVAKDG